MMRITSVEAILLNAACADLYDQNPNKEVLIVAVTTDEGLVGLGECNQHPIAARAFLDSEGRFSIGAGVRGPLIGRTLDDPAAITAELQEANIFTARRGIGAGVLAAVDVALWDLAAQAARVPLWRLLWGDSAAAPMPYGTVYTGPMAYDDTVAEQRRLIAHALALGYRALKVEPLVDCCPEDRIGDLVADARAHAGDVPLLVDFGYRMPDAARALPAVAACAPSDPWLIETPIAIDAFAEWGALSRRGAVPIAGAELLDHAVEFAALIDVGEVAAIQPWANRIGITGARRAIAAAEAADRLVVMAGYNTTAIGDAATLHLAAGLPGVALEHAATALYDFPLRGAAVPDRQIVDGGLPLPDAPGLGVTLDPAVVARLRI